jgi:SRSO17 transposase
MERSFAVRMRELEAECQVSTNAFSAVLDRLEHFMKPFVAHYRRCDQAAHSMRVVQGLCSDLPHKNGESIAYLFGLDRKAIQNFLGESPWDDRVLRAELARQIGAELGDCDGVIAFDPSTFPKSGQQSVGVARQWCGRLGKIENCQVGVYMAYVTAKGHALVDTELFLPQEWTADKKRMKRAGVPKEFHRHRTRLELCLELLDCHADHLPHSWITGDDELGRPADFRRKLRDRGERYLLAVPSNTTIRDLEIPPPEWCGNGRPPKRPSLRADRWASEQTDDRWTRVEVRDAEQGPLIVEALKRHVGTAQRTRPTAAEEVLVVIRYRDRDRKVVKTDYYLSNADVTTPLDEFCRVAKAEHRIEECFQRAKGQAGLADYEVRNWTGWQHHQTMCLLASWFLTVETRRAEKKDTRDDLHSITMGNRIHPANRTRMRYTLAHSLADRTKINSQSTRTTLPLETTQPSPT